MTTDSDVAAAGHQPPADNRAGAVRLAIGLAQGLVLYGLNRSMDAHAWPWTQPALYAPLLLISLFSPLIVIQALGRISPRTLAIWTVGASAVLAALGVHDALRGAGWQHEGDYRQALSPVLIPLCAAGLFIAHSLVSAADHDRRLAGRYPTHFELAWKGGLQTAMGGAFVGVFWALLWLGAALFRVIGIEAFGELLQKDWFGIPATFVALAASLHLTDVRVGLIRGVRTVALTLLSWLTPIMALIAAGFLAALPLTGLAPLFETKAATAILLSAAAVLITLINTIYQDGDPDGASPAPRVLRWTARVAAVTLVPIVAIAGYALHLRIDQYGLTPERIIAAALVLVATVYAVGYPIAALKPGGFMKPIEPTNLGGAYVALACLLALLTPIADPARLSVNDQLARLAAHKVRPDQFDYDFLRFNAAKYGRDALERLKRNADPVVREKAAASLAQDYPTHSVEAPAKARTLTDKDVRSVTPGKPVPPAFLAQDWTEDLVMQDCDAHDQNTACRAIIADFDRDGADDVLVLRRFAGALFRLENGRWRRAGDIESPCSNWDQSLDEGRFKVVEPTLRELEIDGRRMRLAPQDPGCRESGPLVGVVSPR